MQCVIYIQSTCNQLQVKGMIYIRTYRYTFTAIMYINNIDEPKLYRLCSEIALVVNFKKIDGKHTQENIQI
jgi:hypothetical protein